MTPVASKTMYPSRCPIGFGAVLTGRTTRRSVHSIQTVNTRCKSGFVLSPGSKPNCVTMGNNDLSAMPYPLDMDELFCGAETFALGQTEGHRGQPVSEQTVLDFAGVDEFCVADSLPAGCEIGNQLHPNVVHVATQPEPQAHAGCAIGFDNECGLGWAKNGYLRVINHD